MSVLTSARVWAGSAHSGTPLLMMLAIADFADDDGRAYPSVATLARKCRMKPRNAQTIIAALRASGELQVRENEGPRGTNLYRIALERLGVQSLAGVQGSAGVQRTARGGAKDCAKPLQGIAPEPSMNHQEPPKRARKLAPAFDASAMPLPEWLPRDVWSSWVADRKDRRKPVTERAAIEQFRKLDEYRTAGHDPEDVVRHSIAGGFQGLYPPSKTDSKRSAPGGKAWEGAH